MKDLISRQDAIEALELQAKEMSRWAERYTEQAKGVLTAKNVIEDLPSAKSEKKKTLNEIRAEYGLPPVEDVRKLIFAEPERGFWYPIQRGEQGYSAGDFRCSVCGQPNHCSHVTKYCCNCGAKMER